MLLPATAPKVDEETATVALVTVEGDLRIVDRIDVNGYATGSLQVFLNGAWGAVCSSAFNRIAADVSCRQLGFSGGTFVPNAIRQRSFEFRQQERAEIQV